MLGAAGLLTLVTLTGLVMGLAREWLLVHHWGAGARTDAFLIALFLPEVVRTVLGGGVLSSAGLALWQERDARARLAWLGELTASLGLIGLALAATMTLAAPILVGIIGPGLDASQQSATASTLRILAWSVPGMMLQALWTVPLQAQGRFLVAGLGSLLYNLPPVAYMLWAGSAMNEAALAWSFAAGGVSMAVFMLPAATGLGLRWGHLRPRTTSLVTLGAKLGPLLGGAGVSQGLMLLERIVASYLGDGVVTVLNLARKLVNLPLLALSAVNQVLLGLMSRGGQQERRALLGQGIALVTTVSAPAAVGMLLSTQALVRLLFPQVQGAAVLGQILDWYAVCLVLASWILLLGRYHHAGGDTRLPFGCELAGGLVQAAALPVLAWAAGVQGMAASLLLGLAVQGGLLWWRSGLKGQVPLAPPLVGSALVIIAAASLVAPRLPSQVWSQLAWAIVAGSASLLLLAAWLRPWKPRAPPLVS